MGPASCRTCARSSADRAIDYGSIGRGFKSLRAHGDTRENPVRPRGRGSSCVSVRRREDAEPFVGPRWRGAPGATQSRLGEPAGESNPSGRTSIGPRDLKDFGVSRFYWLRNPHKTPTIEIRKTWWTDECLGNLPEALDTRRWRLRHGFAGTSHRRNAGPSFLPLTTTRPLLPAATCTSLPRHDESGGDPNR